MCLRIGRDAENYITFISGDDGLYRCCLVGGFTEFVKAIMRLIRFFDHEQWCASKVNSTVKEVVHELYVMFIQKQAFAVPGSFANRLTGTLSEVRTVVIKNAAFPIGAASTIGLLAAQARAFEHLNALVALSISVMQAEIPFFSIYSGFAAFDVDKPSASRSVLFGQLLRVAHHVGIDADELKAQFQRVLPAVQAIARGACPRVRPYELWAEVLNSHSFEGGVPLLRQAVCRLQVFSGNTTSGVEHVHSKQAWVLTQTRGRMSNSIENNEKAILCDSNADEDDLVVDMAREVFKKLYCNHRTRVKPRRDVGSQKKRKQALNQ